MKDNVKRVNPFTGKEEITGASEMTEAELRTIIRTTEGTIERVLDLDSAEREMVLHYKCGRGVQFSQMLYKFAGDITGADLMENYKKFAEENVELRTRYLYRKVSKPRKIILSADTKEVNLYDLSLVPMDKTILLLKNIMAADIRKGFFIETDSIVRVKVFRLKDRCFVVLVSYAELEHTSFQVSKVIQNLFPGCILKHNDLEINPYDVSRMNREFRAECDNYWAELLKEAGKKKKDVSLQALREHYEKSTLRFRFCSDVKKGLALYCKVHELDEALVLQAAWGILLQCFFGEKEVCFGTWIGGENLRIGPMCVKAERKDSIEDFLKKLLIQRKNSKHYGIYSEEKLREQYNNGENLFYTICRIEEETNLKELTFSDTNSMTAIAAKEYSVMQQDLSVDMCKNGENLEALYVFNQLIYTGEQVKLLQDNLEQILLGILTDNCETIGEIMSFDAALFSEEARAGMQKRLRLEKIKFLQSLKICTQLSEKEYGELADVCRIRTCIEEDVPYERGSYPDVIPYVMDGFMELSRKSIDGWMKSLMILAPGNMVAVEGVLGDEALDIMATAVDSDVKLMEIPVTVLKQLIAAGHYEIAEELLREEVERKRRFQTLWANAQ